jgi:hypothetical protein
MTAHKKTVQVYIDEEYGYRFWFWDTGMTEAELVRWWGNLGSVTPFYFSPQGLLPGTVTKIPHFQGPTPYLAHLHEDFDSWLKLPGGTTIYHRGHRKNSG